MIKRLPSSHHVAQAKRHFDQVFQSVDPYGRPFSSGVEAKAVVFPSYYLLLPEQYDALVEAARILGETTAFYSSTETYRIGRNYWAEGMHALIDLRPGTHDDIWYGLGQVQWEGALYSVSGRWGALSSNDIHAVIGGPREFMQILDDHLNFEQNLRSFLEYEVEQHRRHKADIAWVVDLIENVYGEAFSSTLLTASRFPRFKD